jgi:hypothetical protein
VLLALAGLALVVAGGWRGTAVAGSGSGGEGSLTVVVATRALDAGTVLAPSDVTSRTAVPSDALSGLAHDPADVIGRRLAVAVPSGSPLSGMLLSSVAPPAAGRRLVRLPMDTNAVAPDVVAGAVVDVVAALPLGSDGGRVVAVATARIASVSGGSSPVVTLDVDSAAAARLIWAQTFAKSLRLLVRSPAAEEQPPPDVSGLGR